MLQGLKTYLVATSIVATEALYQLNYINLDIRTSSLILLSAGAIMTLAAKINRMEKKVLLSILFFILVGFGTTKTINAQASSNQKFAFDISAPTLVDAQGYTYKYYPDNSPTGIPFVGVVCAGTTSPFTCNVSIPAFTPGNHSIQLTASNVAGESLKSSPFVFVFVVTPSIPFNIRIISGS